MIRQCFLANTGIRFHAQLLTSVGLDPTTLYPSVKERPAEIYATQDTLDALRLRVEQANSQSSAASPTTPVSASTLVSPPIHERSDSSRTLVNGSSPVSFSAAAPLLSEEEEDLLDAVCPIYDQLSLAKAWWILEILPMVQRYQKDDDTWVEEMVVNRGRPRHIPRPSDKNPLNVHRTVKVRMQAKGLIEAAGTTEKGSYEPRAKLREGYNWVA